VTQQEASVGTHHVLTLTGTRLLGYAEYGDPHGTPVLMFHGWPGSRLQGARYAAVACQCGVRLIAPDRPGIGLSDPSPQRTLQDWPRDVAALLNRLGIERCAVLGVSGGAPYALACARWLSDRLTVAGIASGTGPLLTGLTVRPWSRWGLRVLLAGGLLPRVGLWATSMALRWRPHTTLDLAARPLPDCDRAVVTAPAFRRLAIADLTTTLRDGGRGATHDLAPIVADWGFRLQEITIPVLLWHGALDGVMPVGVGRHVARLLPDCRSTFYDDEGHYLVLTRAVEIFTALASASAASGR
jgi:pimeloyl-ACP methyl ester carboxylesterase